MLHLHSVILQIQYIVPIANDTKFSIKLPKVKAKESHKLLCVPKVC